jgi:thiamine biosynthesis lipoprotein ApbE
MELKPTFFPSVPRIFEKIHTLATTAGDTRELEQATRVGILIDPATGSPAWTGLVAATALAPTALEAEALAKAALLSGPAAGRRLRQGRHGGVLVHDDGAVEPVRRRSPRLSLKSPCRSRPRAAR